ncbi:hypothetical protein [Streptomyces sp. ATCC 21386]|uniref:ISAzo13-like element transposase-related protein n=1 Tax=Streptomyces sp. ATCC 21386 TaxID=2699428 RepID=UPI0035AB6E77
MKPLTWTTKSLRRLVDELAAQGRKMGRDTVAALLKAAGFSLRGNARVLAGAMTPRPASGRTRCSSPASSR